jgi:hypothetical protein
VTVVLRWARVSSRNNASVHNLDQIGKLPPVLRRAILASPLNASDLDCEGMCALLGSYRPSYEFARTRPAFRAPRKARRQPSPVPCWTAADADEGPVLRALKVSVQMRRFFEGSISPRSDATCSRGRPARQIALDWWTIIAATLGRVVRAGRPHSRLARILRVVRRAVNADGSALWSRGTNTRAAPVVRIYKNDGSSLGGSHERISRRPAQGLGRVRGRVGAAFTLAPSPTQRRSSGAARAATEPLKSAGGLSWR